MTLSVSDLTIKLFADGANLPGMLEMNNNSFIQGLTTNPTLMRKAGVTSYRDFALEVLKTVISKSISFEVFADDLEEMKRQGEEIAGWGENVYVKIPVTTTLGETTAPVINHLTELGIKVNVTALMTVDQVSAVVKTLNPEVPSYISVFAGRIADTGRNPETIMKRSLEIMQDQPKSELIWASPRELLNIFQADAIGCHIITATNDILKKLNLVGYDLEEYSLDTVKMFRKDTLASGFSL